MKLLPTQEKRQLMKISDSKMIQILELAGKGFKVAISTIPKYIRVVMVKEKIGNRREIGTRKTNLKF